MADAGEVARALTLLLDGASAEFTAACLQRFLKGHKERYKVQNEIDRLDGVVCLYQGSIDGIIYDIKEETGGEYIGPRERIWQWLTSWELSDTSYQWLSDDRRELIRELYVEGLVKPYQHKDDCPAVDEPEDFWRCTCEKQENK